jgi:hypothetical protein
LREQLLPEVIGLGRGFAVVVDAQAAAEVEVMDRHAGRLDGLDHVEHAFAGIEVG